MEIDHYSDEWTNAPTPYSIFFTDTGDAIHGTCEQRNLGRAVSLGCVRLSVKNAATLRKLVRQEKMANTAVVLRAPSTTARARAKSPSAYDPDDAPVFTSAVMLVAGFFCVNQCAMPISDIHTVRNNIYSANNSSSDQAPTRTPSTTHDRHTGNMRRVDNIRKPHSNRGVGIRHEVKQ